jgi:hypothetical protein
VPFTAEQFFAVFRAYNEAVWPAQWFLTLGGASILAGVLSGHPRAGRLSLILLSALWLWMAAVYHLTHFSRINPVAPGFAVLFAGEAGVLLWKALRPAPPEFGRSGTRTDVVGIALAVFGLAIYPLLNPLFGHEYPEAPGFGLPCPTTIFTIGILSLERPGPDGRLLGAPVLWALIGTTAAVALDVPQDYVLGAAGAWGIFFVGLRPRGRRPGAATGS